MAKLQKLFFLNLILYGSFLIPMQKAEVLVETSHLLPKLNQNPNPIQRQTTFGPNITREDRSADLINRQSIAWRQSIAFKGIDEIDLLGSDNTFTRTQKKVLLGGQKHANPFLARLAWSDKYDIAEAFQKDDEIITKDKPTALKTFELITQQNENLFQKLVAKLRIIEIKIGEGILETTNVEESPEKQLNAVMIETKTKLYALEDELSLRRKEPLKKRKNRNSIMYSASDTNITEERLVQEIDSFKRIRSQSWLCRGMLFHKQNRSAESLKNFIKAERKVGNPAKAETKDEKRRRSRAAFHLAGVYLPQIKSDESLKERVDRYYTYAAGNSDSTLIRGNSWFMLAKLNEHNPSIALKYLQKAENEKNPKWQQRAQLMTSGLLLQMGDKSLQNIRRASINLNNLITFATEEEVRAKAKALKAFYEEEKGFDLSVREYQFEMDSDSGYHKLSASKESVPVRYEPLDDLNPGVDFFTKRQQLQIAKAYHYGTSNITKNHVIAEAGYETILAQAKDNMFYVLEARLGLAMLEYDGIVDFNTEIAKKKLKRAIEGFTFVEKEIDRIMDEALKKMGFDVKIQYATKADFDPARPQDSKIQETSYDIVKRLRAIACIYFARMHDKGYGFVKDEKLAWNYYRKAIRKIGLPKTIDEATNKKVRVEAAFWLANRCKQWNIARSYYEFILETSDSPVDKAEASFILAKASDNPAYMKSLVEGIAEQNEHQEHKLKAGLILGFALMKSKQPELAKSYFTTAVEQTTFPHLRQEGLTCLQMVLKGQKVFAVLVFRPQP